MTGTSFIPPTSAAKFAAGGPYKGQDEDLRKVYTSDGKGDTWYDRLQEYTRASGMDNELYKQIVAYRNLPVGTKDNHDSPVYLGNVLMATIAYHRAAAYSKLAKHESDIAAKDALFRREKTLTLTGNRETTFSPILK